MNVINENIQPMVYQKQVKEIIDILFDFQNKGLGTVFLDLAGHCQSVSVRIHTPCWENGREPDFDEYAYIDEEKKDYHSFYELKASLLKFIKLAPVTS